MAKNLRLGSHGPRGKSNITVLLEERNDKLTPNNIQFYSDQCPAQVPSEKLLPTADENKFLKFFFVS